MALPIVVDFEPENDFGGTISQSQTRYLSFLAHVAPDPVDGIEGAVDALYAHDTSLQRGGLYPGRTDIFASDFDVELAAKGVNRDGHYLCRVKVSYTSNQFEATRTEEQKIIQSEDPLSDPVGWRSSFRVEMRLAEKDINGDAILNSAGDYYDPQPMRKVAVWTHAATVNVANVPTALTSYANAVNNDAIIVRGISCAAETVQITGIDIPNEQVRNGITFVPLTLVYEVDADGFDLSILSQGMRELVAAGDLRDIYIPPSEDAISEAAANGWAKPEPQRASVPVMLDEDGVWIEKPSPSSVHYMEHEVTNKLAFASLPGILAA